MQRKVLKVINTPKVMMGNIEIGQPIPSSPIEQISPFILLHYAEPKYIAPGMKPMDIGPHPHRGFEPVSFVFQGYIGHKDSLGNERVIGPGGVQWMTAGRGIVHSEGAPQSYFEEGGNLEMIQLWINLPAEHKMTTPKYQPASKEEIPFVETDGTRVNIVSGNYKGITGPIDSITDIEAFTLEMRKDGNVSIPSYGNRNILLYQLRGKSIINNHQVGNQQLVLFDNQDGGIEIKSSEETVILFLSGEPIDEPMVSHGPFVMNSTTEIMEAMRDYSTGKMGVMTEY
ncbi:pirin family protein [Reichenbachiella versicolor]|uniref:pirin family protein n=1 Tax=Reichenbachiella versicolor TaxID=1821036 RepID=UPI000D6E7B25|nr:pirin family protein [Reichenbachiella versicolor]